MYYKKPYKTGFIIGRFQTFTKGHEKLVDTGLQLCDNVLVIIGSSQESGTFRNPFNSTCRYEMISKVYGKDNPNLEITALPDLTDENDISTEWGSYLMDNVKQILGCKPDVMIYGNDESRSGWFSKEELSDITEIIINRNSKDCPISATYLRKLMIENNYKEWQKWTNEKIHPLYKSLRDILIKNNYHLNLIDSEKNKTSLEVDRLKILLRNTIEIFRESHNLLYDKAFKEDLIKEIGITEDELSKYEIYEE